MNQTVWTIKSILLWTTAYLTKKHDEHPRLSAEILLSSVMGFSRVELYLHYDQVLDADQLSAMHQRVEARSQGKPLQYITGEMPFRHIIMQCKPGVLIPRSETEVLVDIGIAALKEAHEYHRQPRVLEIGTGSGCIALSLASEVDSCTVLATDVSQDALELAQRNCQALHLEHRVTFVSCSIAQGVNPSYYGQFDLLISNPPYVPTSVVKTLPAEVALFEPHLALDGGKDGLDVFQKILETAPHMLRPGGMLCVELFEDNVDKAQALCVASGVWQKVYIERDLTHRKRFLVARLKGDFGAMTTQEHQLKAQRENKIVKVDQNNPDPQIIDKAADVLAHEGVIITPTDSVYGIGCVALPHNAAHKRTFEIKHRDLRQTLPWLIGDESDLMRYAVDVPAWAQKLAHTFWPGALTLVVKACDDVPQEYVHADNKTIALRLPDSNVVRALARKLSCPLAITSANTHGADAAISGATLEDRLIDEVDLVLDAGSAPLAVASTIVDCTQSTPKILRIGAIDPHDIMEALSAQA